MKIITLGNLLAIAILILGIIHGIATFSPLIKGILMVLPANELDSMLYISLMCAASFIISGALLLMLINKLQDYPFLTNPILFIGGFLLISAILMIIFFDHIFDNPFACIGVILNTGMFWVILNLVFKLKYPQKPRRWYNYLG